MSKGKARMYAESVVEQHREQLVDDLRELFARDPEGFKMLHQLVRMDNTAGERRLARMNATDRKWFLLLLLPFARLGLNEITFAMEDKNTAPSAEAGSAGEGRVGDE